MNWILKFCLILFFIFGSNSFAKDRVVAVIDTGLDINDSRFSGVLCPGGHRDFTGKGLEDNVGHGTHVLGTIQKHAPKTGWCAVILKFWDKDTKNGLSTYLKTIKYLLELKPDYVNYSGGDESYLEEEYLTIKKLPKTRFIAAAGNEKKDTMLITNYYYPASYKLPNITPVENIDETGKKCESSNWNSGNPGRKEIGVNVYSEVPCSPTQLVPKPNAECKAYMTGTSMSTAAAMGKILSEDLVDKKIEQR